MISDGVNLGAYVVAWPVEVVRVPAPVMGLGEERNYRLGLDCRRMLIRLPWTPTLVDSMIVLSGKLATWVGHRSPTGEVRVDQLASSVRGVVEAIEMLVAR